MSALFHFRRAVLLKACPNGGRLASGKRELVEAAPRLLAQI